MPGFGRSEALRPITMFLRITLAGCCLALVALSVAFAGPVYTWVDEAGVTHYSETPPADTSVETRQIEVASDPVTTPAQDDDHYSILNQAERMEKSRLENERVKTELLQATAEANRAKAAAAAASQPDPDAGNDSNVYYPTYPYYYGNRPGHRPGNRPGHRPGNKPGHRPAGSGLLPEPRRGSAPRRPIAAVTTNR